MWPGLLPLIWMCGKFKKRTDECLNVDANRSLSDSWTGFTKFTSLKEKPPKGYVVAETERQARVDEKSKLDNSGRLRGIYFIDVDDGECKEAVKKARRKLEVPMYAALPYKKGTQKVSNFQETEAKRSDSNMIPKTKLACIVEDHESETTLGIISTERSWRSHRRQRI